MNKQKPDAINDIGESEPVPNLGELGETFDALQKESFANSCVVFDNADSLTDGACQVDKYFIEHREFIQNIGKLAADLLPDEIIDEELRQHDSAASALAGMVDSTIKIIDQTKSQYNLTREIMQATAQLLAHGEQQAQASAINSEELRILKEKIRTIEEEMLLDHIFEDDIVYNSIGTKLKILELMRSGARDKEGVTLIFFDINNFKFINETLGYDGADDFMKTMIANIRHDDVVGRLHGDEFVLGGKTQPQGKPNSPYADSIGLGTHILDAHYAAANAIKIRHSKGKHNELIDYIGAKIGIIKITGDELSLAQGDTAELEKLYEEKLNLINTFGTSTTERIGNAVAFKPGTSDEIDAATNNEDTPIIEEPSRTKQKKPSRIAVIYNQSLIQKDKTKSLPVGTVLEVTTDPETLKHTFVELVTVLDPERLARYTLNQLKSEFESRTNDAGKRLPSGLSPGIDLRD